MKIDWYGTLGGSLIGCVGGFQVFYINPCVKGFFSSEIESYTVRTTMKQESGRTYGYVDVPTLEDAQEHAEKMWLKMLERFNE